MSDESNRFSGGLIVSCQAYPGEPLNDPVTITRIAAAVVLGGAAAVRLQGIDVLRETRGHLGVPVIGLVKAGKSGVYITPTLELALEVARQGAEIVAIDGTRRVRPDALRLNKVVEEFKQRHPDVLLMADCGSLEDALASEDAGVDMLGTTLAGYTPDREPLEGPDFELLDCIVATCALPVVAEGRVKTPVQAAEAMARGAFAVCVGSAITHPTSITQSFSSALDVRCPSSMLQ